MASKTSIPIEEREPRYRGRPRRGEGPNIPWPTIDALLVHGERTMNPKTGHEVLSYPSIAVLAQRFGCSRTLIWKFSHKNRCYERRAQARLKMLERTDEKVISKLADTRARATVDVARIVDKYISGFQKALREGKVRVDSPADLDRLVRLKELLTGNADTRSEVNGQISLAAIQGRHRRMRDQGDATAAEAAGVVGHGHTLEAAAIEEAEQRERQARAGMEAIVPELGGTAAVDDAEPAVAPELAGAVQDELKGAAAQEGANGEAE